jgi:5-methylcytosine-specific restriction protein B
LQIQKRQNEISYVLLGYSGNKLGAKVKYDESEPILLYDAAQKAYAPVRQKNRETGRDAYRIKPPGASNRAEDVVEEEDVAKVARAILINRHAVRIEPVGGGNANYLTFGVGNKLVGYRLHSDIAAALGLPPESGVSTAVSTSTIHAETIMSEPTNLIIYGPPGTGKTFSTAVEALRLCGKPVPEDRAELKHSYDTLVEAGQIAFVTFHQNYSYEDFVEGLRPNTGTEEEGNQVGFRLESRRGIFREISALERIPIK